MAQVLIVSNRLPVIVRKEDGKLTFSASLGGLATGLASYANDKKNKWIGWPGIPSEELSEAEQDAVCKELKKRNCVPVFLTRKQVEDFYNGYSNSVLWPLFHNLPFEQADEAQQRRWWRAYRAVNEAFAEAVLDIAKPDSRVWVHDYQLLLLPELLRAERPAANIGFFLHIPFPASGYDRLPQHKQLLRGVLGADLIGFHTLGYVNAFLDACQADGFEITNESEIIQSSHIARAADFPMGIDYNKYARAGQKQAVKTAIQKYQKRYRGKKVIVSVDRLDPSKGLLERLKAYRDFLGRHHELHGKVVFSMVAAPSRTDIPAYKKLSRKLDALATDINDTFGSGRWRPLDYMNTAQPFEEVTALFAVAHIGFIAPLRDGMNLAAKEFIASNRRQGVLILSQTAGAAEELQDAIIVNPRRPETLVAGLEKAFSMSSRELSRRLRAMQWRLRHNTVQHWARSFVDTLQQPVPSVPLPRMRTRTLKAAFALHLTTDYRYSRSRLLLLDYDGTLIPFHNNYRHTTPPETLLTTLQKLCNDERNTVVLVSGRSADDLEEWFGYLPINLIAEHGAATRKSSHKRWQQHAKREAQWMRLLKPVLEKYAALTPGARVEAKAHSLVWHYRASPPYYAQKYAVVIKRSLRPILKNYGLKLYQGNKILEIKDPRVSKGAAVEPWLQKEYDFVLGIGDDFTDEELFEALPEDAYSIKVGRGRTEARFRLGAYTEVRSLLRKLTRE